MHLTLVYPPTYAAGPSLPPGQGASQNIALGTLAAFLKKHGHAVTLINALNEGIGRSTHAPHSGQDLYRIGLPLPEIVALIPPETGCVGISVPFTNVFPVVQDLTAAIRARYPAIPIVMGGVHASAFPEACCRAGADVVIAGEGELPLLQFAGGRDPSTIGGAYFLRDGRLMSGGPRQMVENLDDLPFPERTAEEIERCAAHPPRGGAYRKTVSLVTSRGCPDDCNFCSIHPVYGRKWRARSAENVLAEIGHWYHGYGVRHFEFEDDNLTLDRERAVKIFDGMIARFPDVTWAAHNGVRIDTLDGNVLLLIKQSGCLQLNLAIESGNPTVLGVMNKRLSLDKVEEVVRLCGKLRIKAAGFLLVGYPGETEKSFAQTIAYFRRLRRRGLYAAIPLIVNAYPGTRLFDECRESGWLAPDAETHIYVEDDEFVSVTTPDFDRGTVLRWKKRAQREINGSWRKTMRRIVSRLVAGVPGKDAPTR